MFYDPRRQSQTQIGTLSLSHLQTDTLGEVTACRHTDICEG
jgi:hypothetical protein